MNKKRWSWHTLSNSYKILCAGVLSFFLGFLAIGYLACFNFSMLLQYNGFWTLIIACITSPVIFLVWQFRDKNAAQQIENQRKDINLKEFQKIAEWVSGSHLIEDKFIEKIESNDISIITKEWSERSERLALSTYNKRDGAVGLQIAAIYNLLPFFRGVYGDSFRRPALNLLMSAWLGLQKENVEKLSNIGVNSVYWFHPRDENRNEEDFNKYLQRIIDNGNSDLGIAITNVLLSDGGSNILRYPEVFSNICLSGMNFNLPGLNVDELKNLFQKINEKKDVIKNDAIQLHGANLSGFNLASLELEHIAFWGANLKNATFYNSHIFFDNLYNADLSGVNFINTDFIKIIGRGKIGTVELTDYSSSMNLCGAVFIINDESNDMFISLSDLQLSWAILIKGEIDLSYPEITIYAEQNPPGYGFSFEYKLHINIDLEETKKINQERWYITLKS